MLYIVTGGRKKGSIVFEDDDYIVFENKAV